MNYNLLLSVDLAFCESYTCIYVRSSLRSRAPEARVCVCIPILVTTLPYGTIAAHTRRRASVLVVYVVFCVFVYSFAGLIRRTPPLTFSDTAITDRHSETTIFQLRTPWVRISRSIGSEKKIVRTCAPGVSRTLDFLHARRAP